jgi:hypothetical protein
MFNLPADKLHNAEAGIGTTEGSLPFDAPLFYVQNGKANMSADVPALKFGGWATDAEKMDQIVEINKRTMPPQLKKCTVTTTEGKSVSVYTARSLVLSIACFRTSWLSKGGKDRSPEFRDGTRRHVQILAVMAVPGTGGQLAIWGPVVLSAKGFQAKKLLASMDDWSKHTAVIRSQIAPGLPAFMFYSAIGTFGDQPVFEMVGQGNQKSSITPVGVRQAELTPELMQKIYGGEALLDAISKVQDDSKQWVSAWNVASKSTGSSESLPEEETSEYPY